MPVPGSVIVNFVMVLSLYQLMVNSYSVGEFEHAIDRKALVLRALAKPVAPKDD
jgi:hypothetical protein